MKKGLIVLSVVVVLAIVSVFIFIPKQLHISDVKVMKANQTALFRNLSDEAKWLSWWPGKTSLDSGTQAAYNGYTYRITKVLYNAIELEINNDNINLNGRVLIIPVTNDSLVVKWESDFITSLNPVSKVLQYRQAVKIKADMSVILDSLKALTENKSRLYKFNIHHTTLKDTALVSTKTTTTGYPKTIVIYNMISRLKKYIKDEGAKETNYPMLNITKLDSLHYVTMVAIATDKALNGSGNIAFKRMIIYKDRIVTAEVTGGPETIKQAYDELYTYLGDYHLSAPVIHFEYLVTNRLNETDTTKWKTIIYYPII